MYALKDLLTQATGSLADSLAHSLKAEEKARSDANAAAMRAQVARDDMSVKRPAFELKDKRRQTVFESIRRLEAQLQALREELTTAEEDLDKSKQEQDGLRGSERQAGRDESEARKKLDEIAVKKSEILEDLRRARVTCLKRYLDEMNARLRRATEHPSRTQSRRKMLEALRRERGRDPEVARLCEEREEWQKMLGTIKVPTVQKTARAELERIERSLDDRFPGALAAEGDLGLHEIEELYVVKRDSRQLLLLPIDQVSWHAMERGDREAGVEFAVGLAWATLAGLDIQKDSAEFVLVEIPGHVALAAPADFPLEERSIRWEIGEAADVSFLISRLPLDVEDSLHGTSSTR